MCESFVQIVTNSSLFVIVNYNTFFSIDPARETACVIMMQMLPVYNEAALAVFDTFERAVYSNTS